MLLKVMGSVQYEATEPQRNNPYQMTEHISARKVEGFHLGCVISLGLGGHVLNYSQKLSNKIKVIFFLKFIRIK